MNLQSSSSSWNSPAGNINSWVFCRKLIKPLRILFCLSLKEQTDLLTITASGQQLPLHCAGTELIKLIDICLALINEKNSLLLIDAIESGFHYSIIRQLRRLLRNSTQLLQTNKISTLPTQEVPVMETSG